MNGKLALIVVGAALAVAGCRTNKDILNDYERYLLVGDYEGATVEVTEKAQDEGIDRLLWQLQAGGAQHLAMNGDAAIAHFDHAEDIFIKNDGQSVFSQSAAGAGAMMTNDRVFPFAGGGQDRIFTCLYKAIDYAAKNNVAAARTELNRAAQHQENWTYERRHDIEAARERMSKDAASYAKENKSEVTDGSGSIQKAFADDTFAGQVKDNTGFDPRTDGNLELLSQKDYFNVYVQHVCGVFRWLTGDGGREYLKGLPELNPTSALLARDFGEVEKVAKPQDQVWIYVEDGLCPCREEWRCNLPLMYVPGLNQYVKYVGMALPYLRYRDAACNAGYTVSAGGAEQPLDLLQDMDRLSKVEHDVYMRGALAREITRTVVKAGVQIALGVTAANCPDSYTQLALQSSQWAAAAWAMSVTQADLRSWTTLPKLVYACRVTRPADGKIVLKGNGADVAIFNVPAGNSMIFVQKPAAGAPAAVRQITL